MTTRRRQVVPGLMIYRYDSAALLRHAEDFRLRALRVGRRGGDAGPIVRAQRRGVSEVDITATDALEQLRAELARRGIVVGIARMKLVCARTSVRTAFLRQVPEDRVFATLPTTVEAYQESVGQQPTAA